MRTVKKTKAGEAIAGGKVMNPADRALDAATNFLALHPRWTCALLCALILVAGQMDGRLP